MSVVRVQYPDGQGILRDVLELATSRGFTVDELSTAAAGNGPSPAGGPGGTTADAVVEATLQVHGKGLVNELAAALSELPVSGPSPQTMSMRQGANDHSRPGAAPAVHGEVAPELAFAPLTRPPGGGARIMRPPDRRSGRSQDCFNRV